MFNWDRTIFQFLFDWNQLFFLNWFFVFLSEWLIYFLIAGFAIYIFSLKLFSVKFYYLSLALLSFILSRGILAEIMNLIIISPRPLVFLGIESLNNLGLSYSMPSGHMTALAPLSLTIYEADKKLGRWFIGLTWLTGIGRVITGFHWPSDIIVGFLVGFLSFYLVKEILPPHPKRCGGKVVDSSPR